MPKVTSKEGLHKCVKQYIELRKSKKLTQDDVAHKLGVSKSTIRKVETGNRVPSLSMMERLCFAVGGKLSIVDF
jgi:transcriptional regulator with XRE-family HTH domain